MLRAMHGAQEAEPVESFLSTGELIIIGLEKGVERSSYFLEPIWLFDIT